MTPKIGIPITSLGEETMGIRKNYLHWISQFGDPIVISPLVADQAKKLFEDLDALVLPGGADINPKRYGAVPGFYTFRPDIYLEYFDETLLPLALEINLPIFGICRGLQTLNVTFGGSLYQHINHPYSDPEDKEVHEVTSVKALKSGKPAKFRINSSHHQAINKLANGFDVEMVSQDGFVEAISCWQKNIFAVQWHPERSFDRYSYDNFMRILEQE